MDLRSYKLVTGEEIIGRFEKDIDGAVVLSKVRIMVLNGEMRIILVPWMMSASEDDVEIKHTAIVGSPADGNRIPASLETYYIETTSSIQLSTSSKM